MLSALRKFADRRAAGSAAPSSAPHDEPMEGNALFEALVCEFHWTALQIGGVTSSLNASLATGRTWMIRSCTNLIPVQAPVVKVALRSWQDIGLQRETAQSVARIFVQLADAKIVTVPLVTGAGSFTAPNIPIAKLEQITAIWRRLAQECNDTVQDLEPEMRWRLNGAYTGNALTLGKFLKEAMSGKYACVNTLGEVALPILPQRRRTPRFMLLQPCKIVSANGTFLAFARDISKTGIGVNCERELPLRETVTIELRSGRKMSGIVVWCRDAKLGIQFDAPLAETDPLLSA